MSRSRHLLPWALTALLLPACDHGAQAPPLPSAGAKPIFVLFGGPW